MAERVSAAWVKSRTGSRPRSGALRAVLELTQAAEENGFHAFDGEL
jgi:hypothetical protein